MIPGKCLDIFDSEFGARGELEDPRVRNLFAFACKFEQIRRKIEQLAIRSVTHADGL